ncbi:MAG: formate C-acetyltransferase/glycerol dehydratase family glycyl radical enzyme [Peptococcaceae bacterium]|jgi:formate C-acetyltransferase|nr:formate C-acetyltransferase/glycerol dehydratase family glycyl radical enzyme [Peptococcaceae bacterium]MDH7525972.1 formate C-acetyltransferase/glycerol dehydratase family glycyl radical enzyme [Peptococcaceae bacterium]
MMFEATERVKKLRERMLTTPAICVERGYLMTKSYQETEGQPATIRRAKALEKILKEMTIRIEDGELIVGWATGKVRAGAVLPEISSEWLLEELDTVATRDWDKYVPLTEEEKEKLKEAVAYWKGKSLYDKWQALVPEQARELNHIVQGTGGFSENSHHMAHVAVDYERVITKGLNDVKREVDEALGKLDLSEMQDLEKHHFYQASRIVLDAAQCLAQRYAQLAADMAQQEKDPQRKAELERIAETCRWVPANPARSFYEALQSIWFVYVVLMIEGWGAGISLGRVDQYLYPFYKRDIEAGTITRAEAHELITLLLIKMNGVVALADKNVSKVLGGYPIMQGLTVGGVTRDGRDAVNELSYLFLDADRVVGLSAEEMMVRINRLNPDSFVMKAVETAVQLRGKIKFVSDETSIPQMMNCGIPLEYARDYISTGCHNPTIPAFSHDLGGVIFNLPLAVDLALHNGFSRQTGKQIGPKTGDPTTFKTFEEFMEAYKRQVEYMLSVVFLYKNADMKVFAEIPVVFQSSLFPRCLEKGLDIYQGGAYPYHTHITAIAGAANVGDSLAAIKKVVFDDRKITMRKLITALEKNFEGEEEVLYLLQQAPKFGNDDDYVDLILKEVLIHVCDAVRRHKTFAGRQSVASTVAMTANIPLGWVVGALPDGRKAGEPLSEGGISPYQGRNISGPTATMRSVAKLDQIKLRGSILNMRFNPDAVKGEQKLKKFASLLRTFCEMGGNLIQFNFVDTQMLKEAQKSPEQYKDLLVRVATYSAYFVELSPDLQNDIIKRTEFQEV